MNTPQRSGLPNMAGVLPTGVGPAGASSTPPSPAKPNPMPMCWFTVHHRAFKGIGLPSVACDPQGASGSDIRIAAACANRALACQQDQAFLVVGAPAPWSVAPPDTIPLTRVLADLSYVVSHNRSFASFSSRSRCPSHEKRSPFWMKVVLLSAASRPNSELRQFCTAIGVIDTDVLLYAAHPLTQQPQYVRWHAAPQQILFIAREPASGQVMWQRGSLFDDHGKRISDRTVKSCIRNGWAEKWFDNPINPDWLVCKLTKLGYSILPKESKTKLKS